MDVRKMRRTRELVTTREPAGMNRPHEQGMALVTALLILLVVSVMAALLSITVTSQKKAVGYDRRKAEALNTAEAGVGEALSRIRNGDVTIDPADPTGVAQIFLAQAGSVATRGPEP